MGTFAADFQHHQIRAKEESPGSAGCVGVLQLEKDLQQPEVHEFHRYMVILTYAYVVQFAIGHCMWGFFLFNQQVDLSFQGKCE